MRVFIAAAAAMLFFVVAPVGAAGATPAEGEIVRAEIAEGATDAPIAIAPSVRRPPSTYRIWC